MDTDEEDLSGRMCVYRRVSAVIPFGARTENGRRKEKNGMDGMGWRSEHDSGRREWWTIQEFPTRYLPTSKRVGIARYRQPNPIFICPTEHFWSEY